MFSRLGHLIRGATCLLGSQAVNGPETTSRNCEPEKTPLGPSVPGRARSTRDPRAISLVNSNTPRYCTPPGTRLFRHGPPNISAWTLRDTHRCKRNLVASALQPTASRSRSGYLCSTRVTFNRLFSLGYLSWSTSLALTRPRLKSWVVDFRAHSKNSSRHCLEEDQFHSLEYPAVFG